MTPSNDTRRSKDALVEGDLWTFVKETFPLSDWQKATQHNVDQWLDKAKYEEWRSKRAPVTIQAGPRFRGFDGDEEQVPPSIQRIRSKRVAPVVEPEPIVPEISPAPSPSPSPSPPPVAPPSPSVPLPPPPTVPLQTSDTRFVPWTNPAWARTQAKRPPPKDNRRPSGTQDEPLRTAPSGEPNAPRYQNGHAAFSLYRWQDIKGSVPEDTSSKFSLTTVSWDDRSRVPKSHYRPRLYEDSHPSDQSTPPASRASGPQPPAPQPAPPQPSVSPAATPPPQTPTLTPVSLGPVPLVQTPQVLAPVIPLQPAQSNVQTRPPLPRKDQDRSGKRKRSPSPAAEPRPAPKPPKPASSVVPVPTGELTVHMEYPVPPPAPPVQLSHSKRSAPPSVPTTLSDLLLPGIRRTRALPKSVPKPAKGHYEGFCTQFWVDEVEDDTPPSGPSPFIKYPKPPQYFPPVSQFPYGLPYSNYYPTGFPYPYPGYGTPYYYPPGMPQPPTGYPLPGQAPYFPPSQLPSSGPLWNPYAPIGTVLHPHTPDQSTSSTQAAQPPQPSSAQQQSFQVSSQPSAPPVASSSTLALEALKSALSAAKDTQPLVTEFYVGPLEKLLPSNRVRKYNRDPSKAQPGQYPPEFDPQRLETITYPMRVWKKPVNGDGYFLDMSKVDGGLWWQPSITGWQSILKIIFFMDRDSWKNNANNTKGPIMSEFLGVAVKWKYYECKGVTYCETLDIDTLIEPGYERVAGDEKSFASKATYPQLARGEEVCAGMVSPAVSQEGDECRFPHTSTSLAKMKSRKCPALMFVMSAAEDVMDHRAVVAFSGKHNHPEFPCLEPMVKPIRKTGWKRWHQEVPVVTSSGFYGNNVPYDAPTGGGSSMPM